MRRALEYVRAFDGVVAQHAQDPRLAGREACCDEGPVSGRLGLPGWPAVAEAGIVARDVQLAELTRSRLHVCHVSTAETVDVLRWAKAARHRGDRRGHAAPPAAHRRRAARLRPDVQGQPAAAQRRGRRRPARRADRRHDRRRGHRPRAARPPRQGARLRRRGVRHARAGDRAGRRRRDDGPARARWAGREVATRMSSVPAHIARLADQGRPLRVGEPANLVARRPGRAARSSTATPRRPSPGTTRGTAATCPTRSSRPGGPGAQTVRGADGGAASRSAAPASTSPSSGWAPARSARPTSPRPEAAALLNGALDLGVTLVDTALGYGRSEERIGRHLGAPARRVRAVQQGRVRASPATRTGRRAAVRAGIEQSLRRTRSERIDVYFLHSCPLEVLRRGDLQDTLDEAVAAGPGRRRRLQRRQRGAGVRGGLGPLRRARVQRQRRRPLEPASTSLGRDPELGVIAKRPIANAPWRFAERPSGHYAELYWERLRALALDPGDLGWAELALRFSAYAPGVHTAIVGTASLANLRRERRGRRPRPAARRGARRPRRGLAPGRRQDWPSST